MIRVLGLASLGCVALAETYKPIIGVITQPTKVALDAEESGPPVSEARAAAGKQGEYIAASYIKFVEAAGGRAVPIHYSADEATLTSLAKSVNGILLPGGGVSLSNSSVYYQAGQTLYNAAVKFNDAGEHFPIWGTCLGFEELARLLSGSNDQTLSPHAGQSRFDSENYPVPLVATEAMARSRMFGSAPADLIKAITTENITMNNHGAGVTPQDFEEILGGTVEMLSTNVDRAGRPFVSTFEAKSYPFCKLGVLCRPPLYHTAAVCTQRICPRVPATQTGHSGTQKKTPLSGIRRSLSPTARMRST
jgi:gamma-glutamyl hydrolase